MRIYACRTVLKHGLRDVHVTRLRSCSGTAQVAQVLSMLPNVASLDVRPITRLFRALGDETRVRIVALLTHGELCVCHIEGALGLSQPNASRQLSVLRSAGVVEPRRDGSWVYYGLAEQPDEECRRVLGAIKSFAARDTLRKDLVRLRKVKGPGSCS